MALEADQGQKMDHPAHRSLALGQLSEASGRILTLEGDHETLQGAVQEPQGNSLALQEVSGTCTELQKETQQLREQVEELGIQLRNEKPTSQHLSALKGQLLKLIDTLRLYRAQQQEAEEEQREELRGQQKQRTEVQEALLQEQEAKARVTEENERLRQEVARLTSWTEQLQGEQEELRSQNRELQASLRNEQQNFRICQNLYHEMMAEQRSKEISLTKMSVQCESLTRLRKDLEEERRHLWSQIDTLKELNQSLLEARAGTWTPNIDSLKTMLTGKAEEEDVFTDLYEAQFPAPRTRKRWSRGRAFLRFFHHQRNSSRGQAQSPSESPPGALEATPACSCWLEDRDARRGPPPKATRQQKSAFWSRKKKDEVKDKPPGASSTLSNLLRFCTC